MCLIRNFASYCLTNPFNVFNLLILCIGNCDLYMITLNWAATKVGQFGQIRSNCNFLFIWKEAKTAMQVLSCWNWLFIKIYFMFLYYSLSKFFETIYGFYHAQIFKIIINNDYNGRSSNKNSMKIYKSIAEKSTFLEN